MRTRTAIITAICILFGGLTTAVYAQQGQPRPTRNLQVLPKEWTVADMQPVMQGVAAALGVQCTYCHERDRALDTKPQKLVARKMFEMTMHINHEHLKGIGEPAPEGQQKVTCFTCHRGALKPTTSPEGGGL
jgi:hypothetical protein